MTVMIAMTIATIGRRMKKFDMPYSWPALADSMAGEAGT